MIGAVAVEKFLKKFDKTTDVWENLDDAGRREMFAALVEVAADRQARVMRLLEKNSTLVQDLDRARDERAAVIASHGGEGLGIADPLAQAVERLRAAAAGRREYAKGDHIHTEVLERQAEALDAAIRITLGDKFTMQSYLPSWRWAQYGCDID